MIAQATLFPAAEIEGPPRAVGAADGRGRAGGGHGAAAAGAPLAVHGLQRALGAPEMPENFSGKTAAAQSPRALWKAFSQQFRGPRWEQTWESAQQAYSQRIAAAAAACQKKHGSPDPYYAELGKRDLYFLAKYVLGYKDMTFGLHYPLCRLAQETKIPRKLILIPRKHYKTSCVTIAGLIQWILQDPDGAYMLGTGTPKLVRQAVGELKAHFTHNSEFRRLYPAYCPDVRTDWGTLDQLTVPNRRTVRKEPTVLGLSTGTRATGMSFDRAKLDDLVDEENCTTREQLEAVERWYEFLKFLLKNQDTAVVDISGTRYHFGDLYGTLLRTDDLDKGGRYAVYLRQAVENGQPIFPEKFSVARLEEMRGSEPRTRAIFAAQMMQDPVAENASLARDQVSYHDDGEAQLRASVLTLHLDAAISDRERADYCAFVIVAATPEQEIHVEEYTEARLPPLEFVQELFRYWDKYKPLGRLQAITLQNEVLEKVLRVFINEECRRRGEWLPLVSISVHKTRKTERITRLIPYFQNKRAKIRRHHAALEDQLVHFPKAAHDDLLDAASDVVEVLRFPAAAAAPAPAPAAPQALDFAPSKVQALMSSAFWDRQEQARQRRQAWAGAAAPVGRAA